MINWGIVGLGNIANLFAEDLKLVENQKLFAVASRSEEKAMSFAKKHAATNYYKSYKDLYKNQEIDIVYIATPHNYHMENAIQALESGKHVLCEKPIAINKIQTQKILDAAKANNVFFMEALWSRFNPSIQKVKSLIDSGNIGEIKLIEADFSTIMTASDTSRLYNPNLGGGSLLDIGIYPLFLSYLLLGLPNKIKCTAEFYHTGVDKSVDMALQYSHAKAQLKSTFTEESSMEAKIVGEFGAITIHSPWYKTNGFTITTENSSKKYDFPLHGRGFTYEIKECEKCIIGDQKESELWSHQNSLDLMSLMDDIRLQIGLEYPQD